MAHFNLIDDETLKLILCSIFPSFQVKNSGEKVINMALRVNFNARLIKCCVKHPVKFLISLLNEYCRRRNVILAKE